MRKTEKTKKTQDLKLFLNPGTDLHVCLSTQPIFSARMTAIYRLFKPHSGVERTRATQAPEGVQELPKRNSLTHSHLFPVSLTYSLIRSPTHLSLTISQNLPSIPFALTLFHSPSLFAILPQLRSFSFILSHSRSYSLIRFHSISDTFIHSQSLAHCVILGIALFLSFMLTPAFSYYSRAPIIEYCMNAE